jgi:nitroreductase
MDAIDAIFARHSVRSGQTRAAISEDTLKVILRCGDAAPSSKNARPWRFHTVTDKSVLATVANEMVVAEGSATFVPLDPSTGKKRDEWQSTVAESAATLRSASAGIFVENTGSFSKSRKIVAQVSPDLLEDALIGYALELIGHGAAVENMWIAATSLGLFASFMGDVLVTERSVARLLGLTGDLVGVLALRTSETSPQ